MQQVKLKRFDWASLVMGIVFVFAGIVSLKVAPERNVRLLVLIFIGITLLRGIYMIVFRKWIRKIVDLPLTSMFIIGIIDILIGVFFIFHLSSGVAIAPYIFAIWFVTDSVFGFFELGWMSLINRPLYWFSFISNILGLIVGFMLLFDPIVSSLTLSFLVGFYLLLTGIMFIVRAFR